MSNSLSFQKESIQCSSNASESLNHNSPDFQNAKGLGSRGEKWDPTITTTLTVTIP